MIRITTTMSPRIPAITNLIFPDEVGSSSSITKTWRASVDCIVDPNRRFWNVRTTVQFERFWTRSIRSRLAFWNSIWFNSGAQLGVNLKSTCADDRVPGIITRRAGQATKLKLLDSLLQEDPEQSLVGGVLFVSDSCKQQVTQLKSLCLW